MGKTPSELFKKVKPSKGEDTKVDESAKEDSDKKPAKKNALLAFIAKNKKK